MEAQFPGDDPAFRSVQRIVARYRAEVNCDPNGVELEVRCGQLVNGSARSGVEPSFVDRLMTRVRANPSIVVEDWCEMEDTFFDIGGVEHRSRSTYDTDELAVVTTTIVKTRLCDCVLQTESGFVVRIVLSRESPVELVKNVVTPKHVRIHQRRRALITSGGFGPSPTWLLEFGMVWSGSNKTEAEALQEKDALPQYTLELELLDPLYVARRGDAYVACSMCIKIAELLSNGAHFKPLSKARA